MTEDDRLAVDLTEILAVQCECAKCGTAITYPIELWEPTPMQCPGCPQRWWVQGNPGLRNLQEFANLLRAIMERQRGEGPDSPSGVKIRLLVPRAPN